MNKGKCLFEILTLIIVIAVSNVSFVSAAILPGTYTDHQSATGSAKIDIEGHPVIVIDGFHYDYGDLGSGDVIRIWRLFNLPIGPTYLPVAIFTDIPARVPLFQLIYKVYPTSIQLVNDPSAIETVREGKSKNIHVVWKTDLVVPDELWGPPATKTLVPGITIPPGMLVVRGHGDAFFGSSTQDTAAFSQTISGTRYYGNATFVCPTWDFGGPVGVNEGTYQTHINLDTTVVTTIK